MPKRSAGILLYRLRNGSAEVLLVHPGGPLWASRDLGAWSVPKGEYEPDDDPYATALREFEEETGTALSPAEVIDLGTVTQKNGKVVHAWAAEGDVDPTGLTSNLFSLEWPPRSGVVRAYPEVDRAAWFPPGTAREKLVPAQAAFVDRLVEALRGAGRIGGPG